MTNIEIMQELIDRFGRKMYQGAYLWKYIETTIECGINAAHENIGKDISFRDMMSDEIERVSEERAKNTEVFLAGLKKSDVLFGTVGVRRLYKGKLEQNALDAYTRALDDNQYVVIEAKRDGQEDDKVYTRTRITYDMCAMIEYYGQDEVNRDSLISFCVNEYIYPVEQAFHTKIPQEILVNCIFRLSRILKMRKAFLQFYSDVLDRVEPKVVCFSHGRAEDMCFLREAAQKKGIPTVEIPHGAVISCVTEPNTMGYADYYLTHSDLVTIPMRKNGIKNTFTVGKPEIYDAARSGMNYSNEIVISFISSMETGILEKSIWLAKKLQQGNYRVVYKAHSAEVFTKEEAQRIMQEAPNWRVLGGAVDVRDLYQMSDIVVGIRSTGLVEALPYRNIKVLILEDDSEKNAILGNHSFFEELGRLGDVKMIDSEEMLYQEVLDYQRGTAYRGEVNHYWAPDAEQKFRDFIQIFLDGERPE